jgi:bleomycin hydrolase
MKKILIISLLLLISLNKIYAQDYQFKTVIDLDASKVKSQGQSGTCWSFATSSFLESEITRINNIHVDISEMFIVRNTYDQKAWNYVMRQGKTQLSEGGLAHDVINAVADYGLVPQDAFTETLGFGKIYNHSKVVPKIKKILDAYIKNGKDSAFPNWKKEIAIIFDEEVGEKKNHFIYKGIKYNPITFRNYLQIIPDNYISLTSFIHKKPYSKFVLNIPDNFSNGSFYNVPLEDLVSITKNAIINGYSISLDVDVSEKTFITKQGVATLPIIDSTSDIKEEIAVTPKFRQEEFENYNTTDDHLMHITGLVKDKNNNIYFKVKNSWGNNSKRVGNNGYIYMSIPYFKLKAISILLHRDAISDSIKQKLKP